MTFDLAALRDRDNGVWTALFKFLAPVGKGEANRRIRRCCPNEWEEVLSRSFKHLFIWVLDEAKEEIKNFEAAFRIIVRREANGYCTYLEREKRDWRKTKSVEELGEPDPETGEKHEDVLRSMHDLLPDEITEILDLCEKVKEALSTKEWRIIHEHAGERKSFKEIGESLDMKGNTVNQAYLRALKKAVDVLGNLE